VIHADSGDSILTRGLYFEYGAEMMVSGLMRPAAHVEWLPLKILKLRLQYEMWFWPGFHLGTGHGLIFDTAASPFGPTFAEQCIGMTVWAGRK